MTGKYEINIEFRWEIRMDNVAVEGIDKRVVGT